MEWLVVHRFKLKYYQKNFEFVNDEGNVRTMKGVLNHISIRSVSPLQMNKYSMKVYQMYVFHVLEIAKISAQ
jgi:hypothetical protein